MPQYKLQADSRNGLNNLLAVGTGITRRAVEVTGICISDQGEGQTI